MKRPIDFRMWNCVKGNPSASRMFYDTDQVMECLKQQMLFDSGNKVLGYDHVGDGNEFMQYTGLKDRNGVKVYEGDVNEDGGVVIWNASDSSFCWDYPNLEVMSMGDEQTWCKVTGNIHESGGGEG